MDFNKKIDIFGYFVWHSFINGMTDSEIEQIDEEKTKLEYENQVSSYISEVLEIHLEHINANYEWENKYRTSGAVFVNDEMDDQLFFDACESIWEKGDFWVNK